MVTVPEPPAAGADEDDMGAEADAELAELEPEAALEEPLELQAATLRAQVRASPDTAIVPLPLGL